MSAKMDGIDFIRSGKKLVVDSESADYVLELEKGPEYFSNPTSYTKFVKAVEQLVRTNNRYSAYKAELMTKVKLNHCQVLSDLDIGAHINKPGKEGDIIEMHHGPVFTLFDVCMIMVEYFQSKGWPTTTMSVADAVLKEHEKNRVQVVMLCSSVHEMVHNGSIFLNIDQGYGKLNEFIRKYESVFPESIKEKYNRYMDRSLLYESNDFNNLEINQKIFPIK